MVETLVDGAAAAMLVFEVGAAGTGFVTADLLAADRLGLCGRRGRRFRGGFVSRGVRFP